MSLGFYIFLFIVGTVTGVFSGLLGIGGALVIIPILLYLPEYVGLPSLSMHIITGISAMQTTFATLAASYFHRKTGNVNDSIVLKIGIGIAIGSLSGAILAKYLPEVALMWIYAAFIGVAALLLLLRKDPAVGEEKAPAKSVTVMKGLSFGVCIGLPAGALGFAGSVVIIPLLNTLFSIPLAVAISTGTHIAFIASLMSFLGKLGTGQIEIISALIISVSATTGAYLGSKLNKKLSSNFLRYLLLFLILITLVKVLFDIFNKY
jgi:uncharacterized membrane protein YfcA